MMADLFNKDNIGSNNDGGHADAAVMPGHAAEVERLRQWSINPIFYESYDGRFVTQSRGVTRLHYSRYCSSHFICNIECLHQSCPEQRYFVYRCAHTSTYTHAKKKNK